MAEPKRSTGTVKWFSAQKGFGFIAPDDGGDDLFVHQTSILTDGFRTLFEGQLVEFSIDIADDMRSKAADVVVLDDRSRHPSAARGRGGGRGWYGGGRFRGGGGYGRGGGGGGWRGSGYGGGGGYGGGRSSGEGGGGGGGPCYNCGRTGHLARDCYQGGGRGGRRYGGGGGYRGGGGSGGRGCFNCGEEGHLARDCPNEQQ